MLAIFTVHTISDCTQLTRSEFFLLPFSTKICVILTTGRQEFIKLPPGNDWSLKSNPCSFDEHNLCWKDGVYIIFHIGWRVLASVRGSPEIDPPKNLNTFVISPCYNQINILIAVKQIQTSFSTSAVSNMGVWIVAQSELEESKWVMRRLGMQSTHACIFARFTRKMHGNDTMLESGCGIQKMDA